ncbi:MAG: carboxypeptidase regulatory-like domain-containing protein [bacterium]|nr:carboxypeptidase regulatory-like domain-containing protein [bacterium]
MKQRKMLAAVMLAAFIAVLAPSCTDQSILNGTVIWQDTGGGAEGVSVILFNAADNATMDNASSEDDYTITTTDKNGKYTFTGLTAGSYIVYAALEGFKFDPATRQVEIKGITTDIDFNAYEDEFEVPSNGPYNGSYTDCSNGCLPGNNACNMCCYEIFNPFCDLCYKTGEICQDNCDLIDIKGTGDYAKYKDCLNACDQTFIGCINNCDYGVKVEFECPDFLPVQTCPYNCQAWDSANRTCVGAPSNSCD